MCYLLCAISWRYDLAAASSHRAATTARARAQHAACGAPSLLLLHSAGHVLCAMRPLLLAAALVGVTLLPLASAGPTVRDTKWSRGRMTPHCVKYHRKRLRSMREHKMRLDLTWLEAFTDSDSSDSDEEGLRSVFDKMVRFQSRRLMKHFTSYRMTCRPILKANA